MSQRDCHIINLEFDSEIVLPVELEIEDVKVPLGNAHATEAVVAVRKVVAELQVGAVAAILRLNAVRTGVAVLRTLAVAAIGAQPALPAVGAVVATVAVVAEHAIGASSTADALVRARVTWVCGKTAGEVIEPFQEVALSNLGDLRQFLFILHDLPPPSFTTHVFTPGDPAT